MGMCKFIYCKACIFSQFAVHLGNTASLLMYCRIIVRVWIFLAVCYKVDRRFVNFSVLEVSPLSVLDELLLNIDCNGSGIDGLFDKGLIDFDSWHMNGKVSDGCHHNQDSNDSNESNHNSNTIYNNDNKNNSDTINNNDNKGNSNTIDNNDNEDNSNTINDNDNKGNSNTINSNDNEGNSDTINNNINNDK